MLISSGKTPEPIGAVKPPSPVQIRASPPTFFKIPRLDVNTNVNTPSSRPFGACRLCLRERELRESHFMPAALYPWRRKPQFAMGDGTPLAPTEFTAHLLCADCEHRFNRNGENEVLRWLAPKAKAGTSPLQTKLKEVKPLFVDPPPSGTCYQASALQIDAEKFAYFGLSLLWRAAAHSWPFSPDKFSMKLDLGEHLEPLRRYLLGETPFPDDTHVLLTVCTDTKSQKYWAPPQPGEPPGMFVVPVLGMAYRFWLGRVIPSTIEQGIFFPSDGRFVFSADCWCVFDKMFGGMFPGIEEQDSP